MFTLFAAPAAESVGIFLERRFTSITDQAESSSTDHNIVGSETLNEHRSVVIHRDPWDPKTDLNEMKRLLVEAVS